MPLLSIQSTTCSNLPDLVCISQGVTAVLGDLATTVHVDLVDIWSHTAVHYLESIDCEATDPRGAARFELRSDRFMCAG